MRQSFLPLLLLTLAFSLSTAAYADGFTAGGSGGGISGSGVLSATDQGGGKYLINGISGTGFEAVFAPGGFQGNDNFLFPTASQYVDGSGFAFTVATGEDTDKVDISWTGSAYQAYIVDEGGNQESVPVTFNLTPDGSGTPGVVSFRFNVASPAVASTPEPSSLVMLGTGLGALVAVGRRRLGFVAAGR